jgi:hypothetical protein
MHIRVRERRCVYEEKRNPEYGEAVFPRYRGVGAYQWGQHHRQYQSISKIRDTYYAEINHILNDFSDLHHDNDYRKSYKESFLENLRKIKGIPLPPFPKNKYGQEPKTVWFEWLDCGEIRQIIREWEGEPLDVLYYLAHNGYIEKAVQRRIKEVKSIGDRYTCGKPKGFIPFAPSGGNDRLAQKRIEKRKTGIERRKKEKEGKCKAEKEAEKQQNAVKSVLKKDNETKQRESRRPGPEKFTAAFSFMMNEDQINACQDWRAHTFNEHRQYPEFIKTCVFPYPVPEPLVFAAILPDYTVDDDGKNHKSPDYDTIAMSRRWLRDITGGGSFYQQNREFFTRAESHYFLEAKIAYRDISSVISLYFHAKCRARDFNPILSLIVTRTFSVKFAKYLTCTLITEFLDFIARNKDYPFTDNEMNDISDFVLSKIVHYNQPFSFSGRTIGSLITLANEWHITQQRRTAISKKDKYRYWKGLPIPDFMHETDEAVWEIKQLCTAEDLFLEGQKMKHCVASYSMQCACGTCGIFNVSCIDNISQKTVSFATVEISRNKTMVQARAKCNNSVEKKAMKIIKLWALNNHIKA